MPEDLCQYCEKFEGSVFCFTCKDPASEGSRVLICLACSNSWHNKGFFIRHKTKSLLIQRRSETITTMFNQVEHLKDEIAKKKNLETVKSELLTTAIKSREQPMRKLVNQQLKVSYYRVVTAFTKREKQINDELSQFVEELCAKHEENLKSYMKTSDSNLNKLESLLEKIKNDDTAEIDLEKVSEQINQLQSEVSQLESSSLNSMQLGPYFRIESEGFNQDDSKFDLQCLKLNDNEVHTLGELNELVQGFDAAVWRDRLAESTFEYSAPLRSLVSTPWLLNPTYRLMFLAVPHPIVTQHGAWVVDLLELHMMNLVKLGKMDAMDEYVAQTKEEKNELIGLLIDGRMYRGWNQECQKPKQKDRRNNKYRNYSDKRKPYFLFADRIMPIDSYRNKKVKMFRLDDFSKKLPPLRVKLSLSDKSGDDKVTSYSSRKSDVFPKFKQEIIRTIDSKIDRGSTMSVKFVEPVDRFPHGYIWVANVKINDFDLNEYISLKGIIEENNEKQQVLSMCKDIRTRMNSNNDSNQQLVVIKHDVASQENTKHDVASQENIKHDVVSTENIKQDVVSQENIKSDVVSQENIKQDVVSAENIKQDVVSQENIKSGVVSEENSTSSVPIIDSCVKPLCEEATNEKPHLSLDQFQKELPEKEVNKQNSPLFLIEPNNSQTDRNISCKLPVQQPASFERSGDINNMKKLLDLVSEITTNRQESSADEKKSELNVLQKGAGDCNNQKEFLPVKEIKGETPKLQQMLTVLQPVETDCGDSRNLAAGDVQAEKAADNHAAECIPQVKFVEKVYDLHNSSEKLQNNFDEFDQDKPLERSLPLDLSVENNTQMYLGGVEKNVQVSELAVEKKVQHSQRESVQVKVRASSLCSKKSSDDSHQRSVTIVQHESQEKILITRKNQPAGDGRCFSRKSEKLIYEPRRSRSVRPRGSYPDNNSTSDYSVRSTNNFRRDSNFRTGFRENQTSRGLRSSFRAKYLAPKGQSQNVAPNYLPPKETGYLPPKYQPCGAKSEVKKSNDGDGSRSVEKRNKFEEDDWTKTQEVKSEGAPRSSSKRGSNKKRRNERNRRRNKW